VLLKVVVVSILTTAGATFFTIGAKLPAGSAPRGTGVSSSGTLMAGGLDETVAVVLFEEADAVPATARLPARMATGSGTVKSSNIVFINISVELDTLDHGRKLSGGLQFRNLRSAVRVSWREVILVS